ncbi:hypothetical protein N1027_16265 [Herbiconiux sp. CPCC 205763]|uniref:PH domain-containing protein n=1 Tax=Herbiconiux aconitum TaxID=2970913 RepID=A0ABT2GU55_9MICO|nr:hypothetical protein [Herbiconiux aconitum]MCS5719688.1 hypothetical protein [Herbiconiux aconitum]
MTTGEGRMTIAHRVGRIAGVVWRMELGVWRSLFRWATLRPRVPRGADAFSYDKPIRPVLIVFIVLSAIEIPIIDLIVHSWAAVRIPLLVLGIWGLTWMIGLLLGYLTRPHAVGPAGLRIRHGDETEIVVGWDDVASVAPLHEHIEGAKTFRIDGELLAISVQQETNVEIELEHPIVVPVNRKPQSVRVLRIWVDDRAAYLASVRRSLHAWEDGLAARD